MFWGVGVTRKLLNCKHEAAGFYPYIRMDSILEDILTGEVPTDVVKNIYTPMLSKMQICWSCGSTRKNLKGEWEEWLAPHIWRNK